MRGTESLQCTVAIWRGIWRIMIALLNTLLLFSYIRRCDGLQLSVFAAADACMTILSLSLSDRTSRASIALSHSLIFISAFLLLYCPPLSLIPCPIITARTEDGDRDWRGTEVSHFKEQVKVCRCMIIRSGEGDGSSLHRLRKSVCACVKGGRWKRQVWFVCYVKGLSWAGDCLLSL